MDDFKKYFFLRSGRREESKDVAAMLSFLPQHLRIKSQLGSAALRLLGCVSLTPLLQSEEGGRGDLALVSHTVRWSWHRTKAWIPVLALRTSQASLGM